MADGRWQMADGRWQMADGRWQMADGRWQMADGRWQMADGRWLPRLEAVNGCKHSPLLLSALTFLFLLLARAPLLLTNDEPMMRLARLASS
jgi:hypothetical protein